MAASLSAADVVASVAREKEGKRKTGREIFRCASRHVRRSERERKSAGLLRSKSQAGAAVLRDDLREGKKGRDGSVPPDQDVVLLSRIEGRRYRNGAMTFDLEVYEDGADIAASVTLSAFELNWAANFRFLHGQRPATRLRS